ncbi:protein SCAR1-like isoform X2 [Impatiens glandulifera]|uniref:protein SCAR1-like isoform X2 n=1 Tax=Impatiens glandulifera TaxID=253017 RepID=UPI001FB182FD|nr:protein SCAR1-like isoform X2 [Impatiens glandulifera]
MVPKETLAFCLHLCYSAGSQWHTRVKNEQNLLIYDDLPQFVTDSYEECREPPCLQLLDRFDPGGTGSCLKRYSDPTFFQRASGISFETSVGKASKDRKARRRKCKESILNLQKERACQNNGEASNSCPSIPDQYPRSKFASLDVDDQDISTFSLVKSSELEDRSNSFDSGLGSGYIECDLHPTFTINPQEHGPVELSISGVEMQHNDMFDSNSLDEQTLAADGDFAEHNSSAGSSGLRSSCVTWDEKTEITAHKAETQDSEPSHLRSKYNTDFQFHNGEDRKGLTFAHVNEPRDIEIQLDNNVDALNTVECESESDLDCQSKRELEHSSTQCLHDKVAGEMHEVSAPNRLNSESGSTSYQPKSNSPDTDIFELPRVKESPQVDEQSQIIDLSKNSILHDRDVEVHDKDKSFVECKEKSVHILESSCEIVNPQGDYSSVQFRSGSLDLSCSNTRDDLLTPINDKILSTSNEPQQVPARVSSSQSVQFWTNGGLLGLEPSKPPVFSKDNSLGQDVVGPLNQDIICMNDGDMAKSQRFAPTALDINRRISRFSTEEHGHENNNGHEQIGSKLLNTTDAGALPTDSSQGNGENAQQVVGLANILLSNSFQQKVLALHHEKSKTSTTANIGLPVFAEHCTKKISGQNINDLFGDGSQENNSPPSSPPIQHMKKISFQTSIGSEISKLKLKLPDGNQFHDNGSGDMLLPIFQLVPEPGTSHNDNSLDSDDDTFCRSSPNDSDDCNNHRYESNSEQWGSDTASQNKDNELYDVLGRISLTEESISISLDSDQNPNIEICEEHLGFMHSLDLPRFNTLNPLFEQDTESSKEPTPIHPLVVAACDET